MAGKTKTTKTTKTAAKKTVAADTFSMNAFTFDTASAANGQAMKDGFEKTVASFGDFNMFSKDAAEAVAASMATAGKGAEKINAEVADYTKQAVEDGVAAAKQFAGAKSIQEAVELQSNFAKASIETYIGEVNKIADLYASSMKDAMKPLSDRVATTVELFQAQR